MQESVLDNTPVILSFGKRYASNGTTYNDEAYCITGIYDYPTLNDQGTIAYYGTTGGVCLVYNNNSIMDYWILNDAQSPRKCINASSNGIAFSLKTSTLDDCYAYMVDTGQIFFAGKNTPYYGHRNISELN